MEVGRMPEEEMSVFLGVTRRDFLKFCGGMAALIGLGPGGTPQVAAALEALAKRPQVIYSSFQQCTGCAIQLLQTRTPTVANLILQQISLEFQDNVMAAAGDAAEAQFEKIVESGDFYWVIEGSIPTKIPEATTIAGENVADRAKRVYPKAKGVIAYGSCACYGNVQASRPNPTGAMGVGEFLRTKGGIPDAKVINISRCPGHSEDMIAALSYVLVTGKLPELDAVGRPVFLYGKTIHDSCMRRGHFEAGEFVETFGQAIAGDPRCLYKLGCKGPVTHAPCGINYWNGHVSWCVHNAPCQGCAEPGFWDKFTPFYEQLRTFGNFPAETIGIALGAATVVGLGAHAVASAATGRFGRHEDETKGGER
jgi:NiFe hydrogenase small subunit HydA